MTPRRKQSESIETGPALVREEPSLVKRAESTFGERLYETLEVNGQKVIIGPHEGFVDTLGLPPELATKLHNILYRRKIFNYTQAAKHPQEVQGAIQELYMMDAQKLMEALHRFEQEEP